MKTHSRLPDRAYEVESTEVLSWRPSDDAACTQVHVILTVRGMPFPLILRMKTRISVNRLVNPLVEHRNFVFGPSEKDDLGVISKVILHLRDHEDRLITLMDPLRPGMDADTLTDSDRVKFGQYFAQKELISDLIGEVGELGD